MLPIKIELPDGFLDEEVRCGYTVSAEMKKLWAVELDLLVEFDRVCRKHGITYFADSGTLLGAVRHKGFIPWDDDIDVAMFREDYRKLVRVAEQEFQHPYFFQTPYSDPGLVMGGSRLRNSDTTLISDFENHRPYQNKGCFIDIFVLDYVPERAAALKTTKLFLKGYWRILRYASYYEHYFRTGKTYSVKRRLLGRFSLILKRIFGITNLSRRYEKCCSRWSESHTEKISPLEAERGKYTYQKDWYNSAAWVPFEHISIPVPNGYHEVLSSMFGEYMVMKRISTLHRPLLFDAETPYSEYRRKH